MTKRAYMLDTHIWIWLLEGSKQLPQKLRKLLTHDQAELWLSPVSVWELGQLVEAGRIRLQDTPRAWYAAAQKRRPTRDAVLTSTVALRATEFAQAHPDPADRLICASSLVYEVPLVTVDSALLDLPGLSIIT